MDPFGGIAVFRLAIHDVDPPIGHGGARIPRTDFHRPIVRQLARRQVPNEACFGPRSVPVWASPLRPIVTDQTIRKRYDAPDCDRACQKNSPPMGKSHTPTPQPDKSDRLTNANRRLYQVFQRDRDSGIGRGGTSRGDLTGGLAPCR